MPLPAIWIYIEKFGREVLIDEDHPLAVAQKQRDAERAAVSDSLPPELAPVVEELKKPVEVAPSAVTPPATKPSGKNKKRR